MQQSEKQSATTGAAGDQLASWSHFDHDADMGVCGMGPTLAEAFEQAALAMTAIVTNAAIAPKTATRITCDAPEPEILLVDWLNALVFEMATRRMLFSRFEVHIAHDDGWHLQAEARGEVVDRARHAPAVEIKGATFTELVVRLEPSGAWRAQCVLDV